jgi:hypothetical protein
MSQDIDTSNYVYLCMTANFWGKGKTPEIAKRNCRESSGSQQFQKYGHVLYHIHPDFEVSGINGDVRTPIGHKAIKVEDKIVDKYRMKKKA